MHKRNFTIIEMLIVIAVIGILAGILGTVFVSMAGRAKNEGQANQIKKILHACEQFKQDFGDYPTVDTAYSSTANWVTDNSLAFRLCQGLKDSSGTAVATAANTRDNLQTWGGSYLEETDIAADQISGAEISDLWGNPLAYNFADSAFVKSGTFTSNGSTRPTDQCDANSFESPAAGSYGYSINGVNYARPGTNFLPPVSYALKDQWVDSEMNMPEIWSIGEDTVYTKLQYKKGNSPFTQTNDADNVGGNINVMKIQ